jgi:1A family penicillin-binding protein
VGVYFNSQNRYNNRMKVYNYNLRVREKAAAKKTNSSAGRPRRRTRAKKIFTWLFRLAALFIVFIAILFFYYTKDLPDPNKLLDRNVSESTKIYDRSGGLLYEIHGETKRTLVQLNQVSDQLKQATIAIEDKDFYKHGGISITGIIRSAIADVLAGHFGQGGSTITQQFVKNAILSKSKTFDRKIREIILSLAIEARFSKDEILKLYLNEIPYGRNAYGVESAAQSYFNKSAKDLTLAESAYLAALPQAPSYYNPQGPNAQALESRKNLVLGLMRQQGYITPKQETQAKQEKVIFSKTRTALVAPHFVLMVQDYLAGKYGEKSLEEGGLKVYTTLDPRLQAIAEKAVKDGAAVNAKKYNADNTGLVAIDPKTGQILAMVGSKDYFADPEPAGCTPGKNCLFEPNVNVTLSERQPGSSFKPYVYVTAFDKDFKYNPASLLVDVVTNFGKFGDKDYVPQDYDGKERGPVSMRQAFAGSLNIPAVKTLALIGVENAVQTARNLGITSPLNNCGLSLVLGGCEVKLLDHVAAYSVLANGGIKNEKTAILKILDKGGNVLEEYTPNPKPVLDPQAVYEAVSIMTDNNARSFVFGQNSPLFFPDRTVAAKTGTTQKWHDGWTLGFTPSLAAGVWTGNNDGTFLKNKADGVYVAAPIWHAFMQEALKDQPDEPFLAPAGITKITVDALSGKLPTQYTPSTKEEIFADFSVPTQSDNVHVSVAIDTQTGQPAVNLTPPDRIAYKTYTVLHSEKPDNPDWENPVVNWALSKGYQYPPGSATYVPQTGSGQGPSLAILQPLDGDTIDAASFPVIVSAVSPNQVSRVDLYVDGKIYASKTSLPFEFIVSKNYPGGQHTLAVKATDGQGNTSDTSITVNFGSVEPLTLISPTSDSLVIFPLMMTAESGKSYSEVNFYYQDKAGQTNLIGKASDTFGAYGKFRYSLNWETPLPPGKYGVFAKSNNGEQTEKITITIP